MVAGYSTRSLEAKLGVSRDVRVFLDHAPPGFALAADATTRLPQRIQLALTFQMRRAELVRRVPQLADRLDPGGALWVCWPKRSAPPQVRLESDVDEAAVRRTGLATGLVDVLVVAVDEAWSGLKFVHRRGEHRDDRRATRQRERPVPPRRSADGS